MRATIVSVPKKTKVTELSDYRPMALALVIMKCSERLIKDNIISTLPDTLDPLLFYRCTIESMLSGCITAWYGNCSAHNCKALQRVVS
jgi:hypothetical protein